MNVIERAEAVLSGLDALRRNTRGETVIEPGDCEVVIRDLLAVVKRLPVTADGVPITVGTKVFWIVDEDPQYWGARDIGDVLETEVRSVCARLAFIEYRGTFTIGTTDHECGNLDIYSTRAAAESARAKQ